MLNILHEQCVGLIPENVATLSSIMTAMKATSGCSSLQCTILITFTSSACSQPFPERPFIPPAPLTAFLRYQPGPRCEPLRIRHVCGNRSHAQRVLFLTTPPFT